MEKILSVNLLLVPMAELPLLLIAQRALETL
jgi:hypothetical protein